MSLGEVQSDSSTQQACRQGSQGRVLYGRSRLKLVVSILELCQAAGLCSCQHGLGGGPGGSLAVARSESSVESKGSKHRSLHVHRRLLRGSRRRLGLM